MKRIIRLLISLLLYIFIFVFSNGDALSQEKETLQKTACSLYVTGIGCHHCAVTDPLLFKELVRDNPNLIIIEYEIFHDRKGNEQVCNSIYANYLENSLPRVPFLIFDRENTALGDKSIFSFRGRLKDISSNSCPLPNGEYVDFEDLDIKGLPGSFKIWTKNRVLISGKGANNRILRKVILAEDVSYLLFNPGVKKVEPVPVDVSQGRIYFDNAVMIDGWRLQWSGANLRLKRGALGNLNENYLDWLLFGAGLVGLLILILVVIFSRGLSLKDKKQVRKRSFLTVMTLILFVSIFVYSSRMDISYFKDIANVLPLPAFTFLIAIVDGLNPCNIFVLASLLTILISSSGSRKRLYIVSVSFVSMVFFIYFLFMCAWLNVFVWLNFVAPLRILIGIVALAAGLINCKELFFFKQGVSLTIPEENRSFLVRKMRGLRDIINGGSLGLLIISSLGLAGLASLVELPCTAGFPIIYTGVLSGRGLDNDFLYYFYIFIYNIIYVIPLLVVIAVFISTLKTKQITKKQVQIIKFIGGLIMILLGLLLLLNPGFLGINIR